MTDITEEGATMTHIITIITTTTITAEAVSIAMMMTTTQVQVHLRAALHQAVPATVIKLLPAGEVQEVHQAEVQVPPLEVIRLLQVEKAVAVLRQEVQVHIIDQADVDPDIKKSLP